MNRYSSGATRRPFLRQAGALALTALAQRAAAFRDGMKTLYEQFAMRTNLLQTAWETPFDMQRIGFDRCRGGHSWPCAERGAHAWGIRLGWCPIGLCRARSERRAASPGGLALPLGRFRSRSGSFCPRSAPSLPRRPRER